MSLRRTVGRALRRVGLRRGRGPWVVTQAQPPRPKPVDFKLFAIVGAWMEADVIGATIRNAFAQGCERVFLVDNESVDGTVDEAVAAGAVLAESFATERYDEQLRLDIMNRVVERESQRDGADHIWWLWLDADEFPHGPAGRTVREHLATLDRRFRIVGARFMNHFPSGQPAYIPGFHPLDFQPLCEEHDFGCPSKHRKHPLQRFDRNGPTIVCDRGFHRATSAEYPLREPDEPIFVHHFPYRDPVDTRRRLELLCATDASGQTRVVEGDDAADGMIPRFQTLDAVYRGDWANVRNYRIDGAYSTANPVPWTTLVDPRDAGSVRWYSDADLAAARNGARSEADR
jgi:hypothetical protein